jgi:hypothetical protein
MNAKTSAAGSASSSAAAARPAATPANPKRGSGVSGSQPAAAARGAEKAKSGAGASATAQKPLAEAKGGSKAVETGKNKAETANTQAKPPARNSQPPKPSAPKSETTAIANSQLPKQTAKIPERSFWNKVGDVATGSKSATAQDSPPAGWLAPAAGQAAPGQPATDTPAGAIGKGEISPVQLQNEKNYKAALAEADRKNAKLTNVIGTIPGNDVVTNKDAKGSITSYTQKIGGADIKIVGAGNKVKDGQPAAKVDGPSVGLTNLGADDNGLIRAMNHKGEMLRFGTGSGPDDKGQLHKLTSIRKLEVRDQGVKELPNDGLNTSVYTSPISRKDADAMASAQRAAAEKRLPERNQTEQAPNSQESAAPTGEKRSAASQVGGIGGALVAGRLAFKATNGVGNPKVRAGLVGAAAVAGGFGLSTGADKLFGSNSPVNLNNVGFSAGGALGGAAVGGLPGAIVGGTLGSQIDSMGPVARVGFSTAGSALSLSPLGPKGILAGGVLGFGTSVAAEFARPRNNPDPISAPQPVAEPTPEPTPTVQPTL